MLHFSNKTKTNFSQGIFFSKKWINLCICIWFNDLWSFFSIILQSICLKDEIYQVLFAIGKNLLLPRSQPPLGYWHKYLLGNVYILFGNRLLTFWRKKKEKLLVAFFKNAFLCVFLIHLNLYQGCFLSLGSE